MKKEKQVKSYQRRTKSGKMVTVRAHTASYEAAERANEMATKKGAGKELEDKMKNRKEPIQLDIPFKFEDDKIKKEEKEVMKKDEKKPKEEKTTKTVKPKSSAAPKVSSKSSSTVSGISKEAYKAWYHFNDWDSPRRSWPKEVRETDSALRKQMGKKAYDKYCSDIDDSYSSRGHLREFKKIGTSSASTNSKSSTVEAKTSVPRKPSSSMPKRGRTSDSETGAKKTKNSSTELDKHLAKRKTESWEKYTPAYNDVTVGKKKYRVVTSGAHGQKLAAFDLKDGSRVKDPALYEKILDKHIFPRSSRSTKK